MSWAARSAGGIHYLLAAALAAARVRPGDEFRVEVEVRGRILLVRDHDPLDDFIGSLPGPAAATDLDALRTESC